MKFNKKNIIVFLSILVGIAALWYILDQIKIADIINTFKDVTWDIIVWFIVVQIVMFLVLTWRWQLILQSQGHKHVTLWRLLGYKMVGYGVSFLTPSAKVGGEPVRAGLLSTRENMTFHRALSSVVIDKTMELSTNGLFTIIGFIVILMSFVVSESVKNSLIVFIIIFLFVIVYFNYRLLRGKKFFQIIFNFFGLYKIKRLKGFIKKAKEFETLVIKFYSKDRKYFYYSLIISIVSWCIMFFEFKFAALMVGQNLTILQLFFIICVVGAAFIVPIPMGLGALEAGQIGIFALLGISKAAAVGLAFVIRLKDIILSAIGIILLGIYGLNIREVVNDTGYITKEVKRLNKERYEKIQKEEELKEEQKSKKSSDKTSDLKDKKSN